MKYSTAIFDLDGTLLDTIADLAASANYACREMGFPQYTVDQIRSFVGNGTRRLIAQCVPGGEDSPDFEKTFSIFTDHYAVHHSDHTKPYSGIMEVLKKMAGNEYKMAIVSNKPDAFVKVLNENWFGDYISVAIGEKPSVRRKPAPDTVIEAMEQLFSEKFETVYVGDSEVDIKTAKNAGVDCISVSWGFRSPETLKESGASIIIDRPEELLDHI